jgi:glycerol dehydrogenase
MKAAHTEFLPDYTVGYDAYEAVPAMLDKYGIGDKAVVIGGKTALEKARPALEKALAGSRVEVAGWLWYGGEASHANSHALAEKDEVKEADVIFAVGGGRAIDTCKEVADLLGKPLMTFPTLASNCAPVTAIGVFYKETGGLDGYFYAPGPPTHCFINLSVIADSPDRYFWAGIGDALSKEPEVEFATRGLTLSHTPMMGRKLAFACGEPLFRWGQAAYADKQRGEITRAFEQVVLDIIVSTGLVSNMVTNMADPDDPYYYNSSVAHAFYNAWTGVSKELVETHLHGEVVSFGVLVLLAFDKRADELVKYAEFNRSLGLPVSLADIETDPAVLPGIVERAVKSTEWARHAEEFTPDHLLHAIELTDEYGRALEAGDDDAQAAALDKVSAR